MLILKSSLLSKILRNEVYRSWLCLVALIILAFILNTSIVEHVRPSMRCDLLADNESPMLEKVQAAFVRLVARESDERETGVMLLTAALVDSLLTSDHLYLRNLHPCIRSNYQPFTFCKDVYKGKEAEGRAGGSDGECVMMSVGGPGSELELLMAQEECKVWALHNLRLDTEFYTATTYQLQAEEGNIIKKPELVHLYFHSLELFTEQNHISLIEILTLHVQSLADFQAIASPNALRKVKQLIIVTSLQHADCGSSKGCLIDRLVQEYKFLRELQKEGFELWRAKPAEAGAFFGKQIELYLINKKFKL